MTTTYLAFVAKERIERDMEEYEHEHGPMGHVLSNKYNQLLHDVENWDKEENQEMLIGLIESFNIGD